MLRSQSYHPSSTSGAAEETSTAEDTIKLAQVKTKPTDTVHRQKLIFNDVLKAINADTRRLSKEPTQDYDDNDATTINNY